MTTRETTTTTVNGKPVTCNDYKRAFFNAHGGLVNVETDAMNDYGNYMKYYRTADGHILYECNGPEYRTVTDVLPDGRGTVTENKKFFTSEIWTNSTPSVYFRALW